MEPADILIEYASIEMKFLHSLKFSDLSHDHHLQVALQHSQIMYPIYSILFRFFRHSISSLALN